MGEKLFGEITEATGLPSTAIVAELENLLTAAGLTKNEVTLDELRQILADYVQDVLVQAKEELKDNAPSKSAK